MKTQITHFGEIDSATLQQSYGTHTLLDGKEIFLDLNFYMVSPEAEDWAYECEAYLSNLSAYKQLVENAIRTDFNKEGITRKYIAFHLKELHEDRIKEMLKDTDSKLPIEERILSLLKLKRIGIYPGDVTYAVWDYSIGWQYSDQLIVGNTDNFGKVRYISWES